MSSIISDKVHSHRLNKRPLAYALVDCNNFYASCERLFNPNLEGKPIVVVTSVGGIIVARSNEAKALGIKMADPFFKVRRIIERNRVVVISSNFALYGNISSRVFETLKMFSPQIEIYSIDEAFLNIDGCQSLQNCSNLTDFCRVIRATVRKWTGIPVSIGIATTKTLAKLANLIAKRSSKSGGVLDLTEVSGLDRALESVLAGGVWGIGPRSAEKLQAKGIINARQLRDCNDDFIRKTLGLHGLKTVHELRGISCVSLDYTPSLRKSISSTRSFGRPLLHLQELQQAVAAFVSTAATKLRRQNSKAQAVTVFVKTDKYDRRAKQYDNSITIHLPVPSSDSAELIRQAEQGLRKIFKKGHGYKKAGITLTGLISPDAIQTDLLHRSQQERSGRLMEALDKVNSRMGSGALAYATAGTQRSWKKSDNKSPSYTTRWSDLPVVR